MNPARSLGPFLMSGQLADAWIYSWTFCGRTAGGVGRLVATWSDYAGGGRDRQGQLGMHKKEKCILFAQFNYFYCIRLEATLITRDMAQFMGYNQQYNRNRVYRDECFKRDNHMHLYLRLLKVFVARKIL